MRTKILLFSGIILIGLCWSSGLAQELEYDDFKKVGQAGFKFLDIGIGARQTAMGEAAVTHEGDASALFWNPAGIASIKGRSLFTGYTGWLVETNVKAVAAAFSLGNIGTIGIHALAMDYGTIKGTAINRTNKIGYTDTGDLEPGAYSIGLTFARPLTNKFQFAITGKYCQEDLSAMSTETMAFDFGTLYQAGAHGITLAVSMRNFVFEQLTYVKEKFMLPLNFRVGVSADVLSLLGIPSELNTLNMVLEAAKPRDYSERVHIGAEYSFHHSIALRGGYRFNYDEGGLTLGLGIMLKSVDLGYAYGDIGERLGSVNRISVNVNF